MGVNMFARKIRLKSLCEFLHQSATMLDAGLPLSRILDVLARSSVDRSLRRAIDEIKERVREGLGLAQAVDSLGGYFPELVVRMIGIGERTGRLELVMKELTDYYRWQRKTIRSARTDLAYPIILLVAAVHIVALVNYVLAGWQSALGILVVFYIGAVVVVGLLFLFRSGHLRLLLISRFLLLFPVTKLFYVARFSVVLRMIYSAGVPITTAFEEAALAAGGEILKKRLSPSSRMIAEGCSTLAEALDRSAFFRRDYIEAIEVGEISGELDANLKRLADDYLENAERKMATTARLFNWGVYVAVTIYIIFNIFRFWSSAQGTLSGVLPGG